jgi:hypothetical protein
MELYHLIQRTRLAEHFRKCTNFGVDNLRRISFREFQSHYIISQQPRTYVVRKLSNVLFTASGHDLYEKKNQHSLDKPAESTSHGVEDLQIVLQRLLYIRPN